MVSDDQIEVSWTSSIEVGVKPDERVLRQLRGLSSPATARRASLVCSEESDEEDGRERLLREHFEQLTASFLQPLETFTSMGSLTLRAPAAANGARGGAADAAALPHMMHEWSYEAQTRFLKEVSQMEPPPLPRSIVPQRADLLKLYAAFLRTPHFARWWERRRQHADAAM